ncbi:MAG: translation initiation factor [Flavobacteriaceae bacterium]|nr:translation initiation factor [Flavobacteriaceae bacterium]
MDLQDQLKNLFPEHEVPESTSNESNEGGIWLQDEPLYCHFEKRKGKVNTIIKGYNGAKKDFKELAKIFKKELGVGGSVKNEEIIIQGNTREEIIDILEDLGFKTKKVGG